MTASDETSDEALMLRYQAGDAGAFDDLYARHRGGLFRFIGRQCRTREHAEELFQEVWMNLIQARDRYRVEAQFRTYLFTLAHNKLMDYFRRHGRVELTLFERDSDIEGGKENAIDRLVASRVDEPMVRAESQQQSAAILRAIEGLPAPQREAFLLHEEGGLSVEDIAEATGCTFEAAKSRLRYAIAKLRDGLQEYA
ncbi:MAG: sigma-70 family RNA polymerase sigma factor [Betaproteobacteria bacterium]|nr:sigma-70 family RNA polymerase sigma factor [Betaproteobacteria bacterium]